jgi:hypothetical protein
MTYSLELYRDFIELKPVTIKQDILPASVLRFVYNGRERFAIVLTSNWLDKMHAIQIKDIGPVKLIQLLEELQGFEMALPEEIQGAFTRIDYTEPRPYRTFTLNKMSQLTQVWLKHPEITLDTDSDKLVEINELEEISQQISNEELTNE